MSPIDYDLLSTRVGRLEVRYTSLSASLIRVSTELDAVTEAVSGLRGDVVRTSGDAQAATEALSAKLDMVLDAASRRGAWERFLDRIGGKTIIMLSVLALVAYLFGHEADIKSFSASLLGADVGVSAGDLRRPVPPGHAPSNAPLQPAREALPTREP